jgi:hypothetical protein
MGGLADATTTGVAQVDLCFKRSLPEIDALYDANTGEGALPGARGARATARAPAAGAAVARRRRW